jgi:ribosomal protein L21
VEHGKKKVTCNFIKVMAEEKIHTRKFSRRKRPREGVGHWRVELEKGVGGQWQDWALGWRQ